MPTMEIVRCALTLDTTPPTHEYGWAVSGVATWYCLPFCSPNQRERFVRLLADHVTAPADEGDTLAALLCLSRSPDDAAYSTAAACLEREFVALLPAELLGELDDAVDRLLKAVRGERTEGDE